MNFYSDTLKKLSPGMEVVDQTGTITFVVWEYKGRNVLTDGKGIFKSPEAVVNKYPTIKYLAVRLEWI